MKISQLFLDRLKFVDYHQLNQLHNHVLVFVLKLAFVLDEHLIMLLHYHDDYNFK